MPRAGSADLVAGDRIDVAATIRREAPVGFVEPQLLRCDVLAGVEGGDQVGRTRRARSCGDRACASASI